MTSCKFRGGLGNQMFQIAATCALALRNNDLYIFNFNKWEEWKDYAQGFNSSRYKNTIYKKLPYTDEYNENNLYMESSYTYDPIPYSPNITISGRFQSEKYFKDYSDDIKNLFDLSYNLDIINCILNDIPRPITSIHVRRGDYFENKQCLNELDIEYYTHAMTLTKNESFLIFSDDINWCKQHFDQKNIFFFEENDELINLIAMSLCDHNIIANSTFSWWGAYLNKNKHKTIIAPKIWVSPRLSNFSVLSKDVVPDDWIKI